ncbi:MAG TPA: TIM barrel protein, partial [Ktedonobacteraceae bacterium]|nr:TIM barrel protein [Ktedonobacteraceae bacterium]
MNDLQVALELYTVRDEMKRDFSGTLRRVAQMGYEGVEFAGYGNLSAQAMASLLAETGLQVPGTHVGLDGLSDEQLDASISYCRAIGCPAIALPSLPQQLRTLDGIRALGPKLNIIGQRCRDAGITFGYHNHDFEFASIE